MSTISTLLQGLRITYWEFQMISRQSSQQDLDLVDMNLLLQLGKYITDNQFAQQCVSLTLCFLIFWQFCIHIQIIINSSLYYFACFNRLQFTCKLFQMSNNEVPVYSAITIFNIFPSCCRFVKTRNILIIAGVLSATIYIGFHSFNLAKEEIRIRKFYSVVCITCIISAFTSKPVS